MSIAIIIPSSTTWESAFGRCLVSLTGQLAVNKIPHATLNIESSILPQSRQLLFNFACKHKYALCLDSDMIFPMDLVPQLMKHDKPIVCANYVTRMPCHFVCHNMDGERMDSRGKTGLEQAKRVALGCALVDMDYIRDLPKPWFDFTWMKDKQDFCGEDYYFSDLCSRNNIEMYVDHDLSQQVGHVKTIHLMPNMVL